MGATNCPETPRQKMIGMMYLVYLALLALNVSAMLLNSFVTVSDTMDASNANIQTKVADTYNKFEQFATTNPDKVGEFYEVAKEVRTYSDELRNFVDSMKYDFIGQLEKKASVDTSGDGNKVSIPLMQGDKVDVKIVERIVKKPVWAGCSSQVPTLQHRTTSSEAASSTPKTNSSAPLLSKRK